MSTFWEYQLKDRPKARPRPKAPAAPESPRRRHRWLVAAIALLALLIGVGGYRAVRPRGDLAKVQKLRQELFSQAARSLSPEERRARAEQLRRESAKLSPDQRAELFAAGQKRMKERLDRYFAMSPRERQQFLDQEIDRMEQMRRERANANAGTGTPAAFGTGPRPGGSGGRPRSPEEIEHRRKERLDRTTPEQRATMDQMRARMTRFHQDLNQRRAQRGMPPMSGPGGSGRR